MHAKEIEAAIRGLPWPMPDGAVDRMTTLLAELDKWNRRVNLTAIRDPAAMVTRHLVDSLTVLPLLEGTTVLDIGTGAGFPGLPLAIADPARRFTLLDSNTRKIQFVQHVVGLLDLDNVTAVMARAEDFAPGHRFDTVTARAVAAIPRLLEIAGRHVGEDGVFVALKGRYPAEELEEVTTAWNHAVMPLDVPGLDKGSRHAVLLRRAGS